MQAVVLLSLILSLSSPDYATREKATVALKHLGPAAAPALSWGKKHGDQETASRCAKLLAIVAPVAPERVEFGLWNLPYIDYLPERALEAEANIDVVRDFYLQRAKAMCTEPQGAPWYPEKRLATSLWLDAYWAAWGGDDSPAKDYCLGVLREMRAAQHADTALAPPGHHHGEKPTMPPVD